MGQDDAKTIFTKATGKLQVYNIDMSLDLKTTDKNGRVKEKGFDVLIAEFGEVEKTRMLMQRPERAAGVTIVFTKLPEEIGSIEVFTPANGKIRKMKATPENMAMVGSDFSIADFASRGIDNIDFLLVGTEELDGKICHKIEASENTEGLDGKAVFLVEKSSYSILQVQVYDEKGEQNSITRLSDFQAIEGIKGKSQPMSIHTQNLKDNKTTEIKVLKITPRFNLTEDDFSIEKITH